MSNDDLRQVLAGRLYNHENTVTMIRDRGAGSEMLICLVEMLGDEPLLSERALLIMLDLTDPLSGSNFMRDVFVVLPTCLSQLLAMVDRWSDECDAKELLSNLAFDCTDQRCERFLEEPRLPTLIRNGLKTATSKVVLDILHKLTICRAGGQPRSAVLVERIAVELDCIKLLAMLTTHPALCVPVIELLGKFADTSSILRKRINAEDVIPSLALLMTGRRSPIEFPAAATAISKLVTNEILDGSASRLRVAFEPGLLGSLSGAFCVGNECDKEAALQLLTALGYSTLMYILEHYAHRTWEVEVLMHFLQDTPFAQKVLRDPLTWDGECMQTHTTRLLLSQAHRKSISKFLTILQRDEQYAAVYKFFQDRPWRLF